MKKLTAAQRAVLDDLVGQKEIADELGISRSLLSMWLQRHDDFPEPVLTLSAGRFWLLSDIKAWDAKRETKKFTPEANR